MLPDPASEQGERIAALFDGFVLAALAVAAIVWGLIAYVLIKYRRRSDDVPNQNPYNVPLEILYTATPVLVVVGLFAFSYAVQDDVDDLVADPDVVVEVVGFQWQWRFTYPEEGISLIGTPESGPPVLVVPVDEVVRFELAAADVIHSFWVPRFLEKRDLIPGIDNEMDVTPNELGTYVGRCTEFCGLDHWRMYFEVRVVERPEYESWLEEQRDA